MKIVADSKIPFLNGVFENSSIEVSYLSCITRDDLIDADALIVRTRTRCDRQLLDRTNVKFVATATIGFDHIDLNYLHDRGIGFSSSSGCNARGVAQWVMSALLEMEISNKSILGIVGVGNVGSQLKAMAEQRGWTVLLNDPPRAQREGGECFVSLDTVLSESDVVSMHVPLNDSTCGMVSTEFFDRFEGFGFLNSSRASVVDESALIGAIESGRLSKVALDVWKNEPDINLDLLNKVNIATPHIAGYSKRGKIRATEMAVQSIARWFDLDETLKNWSSQESYMIEEPEDYSIIEDDINLRNNPADFEALRNNYNYR